MTVEARSFFLGRVLCRIGLHKWLVTNLGWRRHCARMGCSVKQVHGIGSFGTWRTDYSDGNPEGKDTDCTMEVLSRRW